MTTLDVCIDVSNISKRHRHDIISSHLPTVHTTLLLAYTLTLNQIFFWTSVLTYFVAYLLTLFKDMFSDIL